MHILTRGRIVDAIAKFPQAESALLSWYSIMKKSEPKDFAELKQLFPAVDKVGQFHVFDIGGNKIRLIAVVKFHGKRVYIGIFYRIKNMTKTNGKRAKYERDGQTSD